jgi:hypothetical protein
MLLNTAECCRRTQSLPVCPHTRCCACAHIIPSRPVLPCTAPGFDRVRNVEIARKDVQLEHMEEAFTSEHWIVRIYKLKEPGNRAER